MNAEQELTSWLRAIPGRRLISSDETASGGFRSFTLIDGDKSVHRAMSLNDALSNGREHMDSLVMSAIAEIEGLSL